MRRIQNLLRWFNLLLILVTFLAYLSPYISPEKIWFITLFGIAYPWLLLANLLFIAIWLTLRNKYFLFSLVCIVLGWNHLTGFIGLNMQADHSEKDLKVLTFNAHGMVYLQAKNETSRSEKTKALFDFLYSKGQPDIFCVQEINDYHSQVVLEQLDFKYHHKLQYIGTAIFSKYPIVDKGNIEFNTRVNSCVWADIKAEDQTIRVYSIHLQSNRVSGETNKVITEGQIKEKETWLDIKSILRKFKRTSKIRAQQAEKIAYHIKKCPHPVIVCGDFNETPQSYVYKTISKGLKDTFKEKGIGIGSTYAGAIPALRIDYILCNSNFKVLDNRILKKAFSDHYPVISTVSIK